MSGKKAIDEAKPDARLNALCFLAPTLTLAALLFLSIVVFKFVYRSAWFAINIWPVVISVFYLVMFAPIIAMCASIEMRSPVDTRRHQAAAKSLLLGIAASVLFLIAAWVFFLRR